MAAIGQITLPASWASIGPGQPGLALEDRDAETRTELAQRLITTPAPATMPAARSPDALSEAAAQVLDLAAPDGENFQLSDLGHPVTAYLNGLAPSSRRPQLSALRGVLRECSHAGLLSMEEYRVAIDVEPVRGESEPRGRELSAGELRALLEACARAPGESGHRQDSLARRRRSPPWSVTRLPVQHGKLRVVRA